MKPKTTREVIDVLDSETQAWKNSYCVGFNATAIHHIACLKRAIAIVRASRKGRAKK